MDEGKSLERCDCDCGERPKDSLSLTLLPLIQFRPLVLVLVNNIMTAAVASPIVDLHGMLPEQASRLGQTIPADTPHVRHDSCDFVQYLY